MNTTEFGAGARLLVIGLGRSGQATAEVLRARGASITVVDEKPCTELREAIDRITSVGAAFVEPDALPTTLQSVDAAIVSPGVPLTGALVRAVQQANVPVYSEIEVAYRLSQAPMIAVTGTKGKSTTTSLIAHMLRCAGLSVRVGGNIGNPLIAEVADGALGTWIVAEVSSFQLESIRSFHPKIAVILNIAPDHLDRYHSMEEYAEAKYRIFANQNEHDVFIGNLDDERLATLHWLRGSDRVRARQLWFTCEAEHRQAAMYVQQDVLTYAPVAGDPRPLAMIPCSQIPLPGQHSVQNVMAASLAALAAGADFSRVAEAIRSFSPMAHRLSTVAEIDGVTYVDDSKATNPTAAIAALHAFERPVILIAGGRSKNTDFTELAHAIDERAKAAVLIGEAAPDLAAHLHESVVKRASSMDEAVAAAREIAVAGDVVLLSPACASFDMFSSAEDRGRQFSAAVLQAAEPARR